MYCIAYKAIYIYIYIYRTNWLLATIDTILIN